MLNGTQSTILSGISYEPFGDIKSMTYGNGVVRTVIHDLKYQTTGITDSDDIMNYSYDFDPVGNITRINNNLAPVRCGRLGYDSLNRLLGASSCYYYFFWMYDETGNRSFEFANFNIWSKSTTYSYDPLSSDSEKWAI